MTISAFYPRLTERASRLARWLMPPECLLCGTAHESAFAICHACEHNLPTNSSACYRCALPLDSGISESSPPYCLACRRNPPAFSRTHAPWLMQAGIQQLIHLWKFQGRPDLTPALASLVLAGRASAFKPESTEPPILVPVPTHWRRRFRRGFDHTWLLANALQRRLLTRPAVRSWLKNTGYHPPQHQLGRASRWQTGTDRFHAQPEMAGRPIWLIDDVMTTGATLRAAAQACRDADAGPITLYCIARTPPPAIAR